MAVHRLLLYFLFILGISSCSEPSKEGADPEEKPTQEDVISQDEDSTMTPSVPILQAEIDSYAMKQIGIVTPKKSVKATIDYYHSSVEVERWSEKMWGRCCTEADMSFVEWLGFEIKVSHEGEKYPFENALDADYNTTFVFEEKDNITITVKFDENEESWRDHLRKDLNNLIKKGDTIMSNFQISLINGFSKSEKTFTENARVKEVEIWLNDEHKCNVTLLDKPDVQMITANFPFFKNDVIKIKPISIYKGNKYDDVCISEIQNSLSDSCHPKIRAINIHN